MPCGLTIEVKGINPSASNIVDTVLVSGNAPNCEEVEIHLQVGSTGVQTERATVVNGEYFKEFYYKPGVECGSNSHVYVFCTDYKDCEDKFDFELECESKETATPRYVTYYDCTGWDSTVEVMNLQSYAAAFKITAYSRDGIIHWSNAYHPDAHETVNIPLDSKMPRHEGMVVVEPFKPGEEFPSVLKITNVIRLQPVPDFDYRLPDVKTLTELFDYIKRSVNMRFVPFTRVP